MDKETKERLENTEIALRKMYEDGQVPAATMFKLLVVIADDWIRAGVVDQAKRIAQTLPVSYFEKELQEQMLTDPIFCETAYSVALRFVETGVEIKDQFSFSRPPALA